MIAPASLLGTILMAASARPRPPAFGGSQPAPVPLPEPRQEFFVSKEAAKAYWKEHGRPPAVPTEPPVGFETPRTKRKPFVPLLSRSLEEMLYP